MAQGLQEAGALVAEAAFLAHELREAALPAKGPWEAFRWLPEAQGVALSTHEAWRLSLTAQGSQKAFLQLSEAQVASRKLHEARGWPY
mmetsp:Transcript_18029/g.35946  ORF Transcript_18029/g.35946 Transcript_18029/m.35946 type:complete len:88 (+) Transcript_18029:169-432(+)